MSNKSFYRAARNKSGRRYRPSRVVRFAGRVLISAVLTFPVITGR